jgi:hypothetical protein
MPRAADDSVLDRRAVHGPFIVLHASIMGFASAVGVFWISQR